MPQIRPYQPLSPSTTTISNPRAGGEQTSLGGFGEGLQNLGQGLSKFANAQADILQQDEILSGEAKMTGVQQKSTQFILNLAHTDTEDMSLGAWDKFKEKFDEEVGPIVDEATTSGAKNHLSRRSNDISKHLYEKFLIIKDEQSRERGLNSAKQVIENDKGTILLDHSQWQNSIKEFTDNISKDMRLTPDDRAKIIAETKREYAETAIMSMAKENPYYAEKMYKTGRYNADLGGTGMKNAERIIDSAKQMIEAERSRLEAKRERERKQQFIRVFDENFEGIVEGKVSAKDIYTNPDLDGNPEGKQKLIGLIRTFAKQKYENNDAVEYELFRRINLPYGDPNKITDSQDIINQVGPGGLNHTGYSRLMKHLTEPDTPEGKALKEIRAGEIKIADAMYNKDPMIKDPIGMTRLNNYRAFLLRKEAEAREKGIDPATLYLEKDKEGKENPNWVGKYRRVFAAQSITETVQNMTGQLSGLSNQRYLKDGKKNPRYKPPPDLNAPLIDPTKKEDSIQPGESEEDFIKRMKEKKKEKTK